MMRHSRSYLFYLSILVLLFLAGRAQAKWVKFSVDMTGQTISPNGVHVSGDFQDEAGYPADWESGTTTLIQETGTQIYSIKVNIPAFRKYEYKFVNGDQFYEVEFVPEKSRVGFDFNDNRWIYVDSLSADTLVLPSLLFGGNAPAGQLMIRFVVDMGKVSSINSSGVHAGGTFGSWNVTPYYLWSFSNKVYEGMAYVTSGSYEYKFLNGRLSGDYETISGACVNSSGNRTLTVNSDTVLAEVCFSSCLDCTGSAGMITGTYSGLSVYPNPVSGGHLYLSLPSVRGSFDVSVFDATGRLCLSPQSFDRDKVEMDLNGLAEGLYLIRIRFQDGQEQALRLMVD